MGLSLILRPVMAKIRFGNGGDGKLADADGLELQFAIGILGPDQLLAA